MRNAIAEHFGLGDVTGGVASAIRRRFGRWSVMQTIVNARVLCRCDCGTVRFVMRKNLVTGKSTSCGCIRMDRLLGRFVGRRYGRLVVLRPARLGHRQRTWVCRCDCGRNHVAWSSNLVKGRTVACGSCG